MRRWDALVEGYLEQCRARGLADETLKLLMHTLDDWGVWMKRRRPRPVLERIEPQLLVDYLASRSSFPGQGHGVSHAQHDARHG